MSGTKAILFGPLPPPYGGVSVFMDSLKEICLERGVEVWSYTGDGGDDRVQKVSHRRLAHLSRVSTAARIIDSSHFHLEYPHPLLLNLWLLAKRRSGFRWVKICHDGSLPSRYQKMSSGERRRVAKAVAAIDELVVTSPSLVDFFRDSFGASAKYISPLLPFIADERPRNRGGRSENVITSVGAFIPSYGFQHLADAVDRLRTEGIDLKLTLIDGAFARDEDYKRAVLKNRPWIDVHEGIPRAEVAELIANSSVFLRPVEHESYGLSRVEAIMSGTPVIATNVGETRGMLTYEFGDIDTLTGHLRDVLDGRAGTDLQHWSDVYKREAETNLRTYLQLITGDANA